MNSDDNQEQSDGNSLESQSTKSIIIESIKIKEFSDASFTEDSTDSDSSYRDTVTFEDTSSSSSSKEDRNSSDRDGDQEDEPSSSGPLTRSRKRLVKPITVKKRRKRNRSNRSKKRSENLSSSSTNTKLHYRNYRTHFHRRATFGKFSLMKVLRHWIVTMNQFVTKYHKEIFLVMFCIASGLASLRTGPLKTKTVPSPSPFFSPEETNGFIEDFYRGEYVELARHQIPYKPSVIFYYAHWDSESVESKSEFLSVAKYFQSTQPGLIKFYAVNCWWPEGQCHQNYKSLSHYPILVVHPGSASGVIYNGPIRAEPLIRFINSVLKPFTRIDTEEELWRFRAQHDAIMLTSFNSTEADFDPSYSLYRQMALRNLETDPFSQIGFGLILRRDLGEKFYLTSSKTISLILFNEIHTAKWVAPDKGMKGPIGQVADWITERTSKPPITWSYQIRNGFANRVVALGASDLSEDILKRPLFLLVTRRYYPSAYSPFYNQLKEVALDYFNCNKSFNVTKLRRLVHKLNTEWMKLWKSLLQICKMGSMNSNCQYIWEQLEHWTQRKKLYIQESFKNYENISGILGFTGLSCKSSRSFQFVTIDPIDIPYFTKLTLGIHVDPYTNSNQNYTFPHGTTRHSKEMKDPIAFIIDAQNEVMLQVTSFNISEIARTISNYTREIEKGTKNFKSSQLLKSSRSQLLKSSRTKLNEPLTESSTVRTFNSKELIEFLQSNSSSPLLLMYSAQFCGFCSITLAQFVRLGQFLKQYKIDIVLGKIDTFQNSLPLNLTPQKIPTFVFYPAHNRSDSRIFSTGGAITSKILLKFLLSELDPISRVEMSFQKSTQGIRKNKGIVTSQIHSILQNLRFDSILEEFHRETAQTNLLVDITMEAIFDWRNELLDHLRSMSITLDTTTI